MRNEEYAFLCYLKENNKYKTECYTYLEGMKEAAAIFQTDLYSEKKERIKGVFLPALKERLPKVSRGQHYKYTLIYRALKAYIEMFEGKSGKITVESKKDNKEEFCKWLASVKGYRGKEVEKALNLFNFYRMAFGINLFTLDKKQVEGVTERVKESVEWERVAIATRGKIDKLLLYYTDFLTRDKEEKEEEVKIVEEESSKVEEKIESKEEGKQESKEEEGSKTPASRQVEDKYSELDSIIKGLDGIVKELDSIINGKNKEEEGSKTPAFSLEARGGSLAFSGEVKQDVEEIKEESEEKEKEKEKKGKEDFINWLTEEKELAEPSVRLIVNSVNFLGRCMGKDLYNSLLKEVDEAYLYWERIKDSNEVGGHYAHAMQFALNKLYEYLGGEARGRSRKRREGADRVIDTKETSIVEKKEEGGKEREAAIELSGEEVEAVCKVIENSFYGQVPNNVLDKDRFFMLVEKEVKAKNTSYLIEGKQSAIINFLQSRCIEKGGEFYFIDSILEREERDKVISYIKSVCDKGVVYYSDIYKMFSNTFEVSIIDGEEMLKKYLAATCTEFNYYNAYLSKEEVKTVTIKGRGQEEGNTRRKERKLESYKNAIIALIEESGNNCVTIEEMCQRIEASESALLTICCTDTDFFNYGKGRFGLCANLGLTEEEKEEIIKAVEEGIKENGYITVWEVYTRLEKRGASVIVKHRELETKSVIRGAIKFIGDAYVFNSDVITRKSLENEGRKENSMGARQVLAKWAEERGVFGYEEVKEVVFNKGFVISRAEDILLDIVTALGDKEFVYCPLPFCDVDKMDRMISIFMQKSKFRGIGEVTSMQYDSFVSITKDFTGEGKYYKWNKYLLRSYLLLFSKEWTLYTKGCALNKVTGLIGKRESGKRRELTEDLLIEFLRIRGLGGGIKERNNKEYLQRAGVI